MKLSQNDLMGGAQKVASRAEAWIETFVVRADGHAAYVASRAEAWIETLSTLHSPRENGVASRAEAWIETVTRGQGTPAPVRRLPCGGVD